VVAESDVVFGPRTSLVCDANQIPFEDATFDAVIGQAVLEYVADPFQVADEIHRVLRPGGYVYAESPFMQQVHGGPYDFYRFTHVGHRRLFRRFEEVKSGVACGPGMALSWSYRYFLRTFTDRIAGRAAASIAADLTSFWLARLDARLAHRPGAFDAASAFYFLGRSIDTSVPDREIVAGYRGAWKMHA
jgi:SAM-dependent methyltransferase